MFKSGGQILRQLEKTGSQNQRSCYGLRKRVRATKRKVLLLLRMRILMLLLVVLVLLLMLMLLFSGCFSFFNVCSFLWYVLVEQHTVLQCTINAVLFWKESISFFEQGSKRWVDKERSIYFFPTLYFIFLYLLLSL